MVKIGFSKTDLEAALTPVKPIRERIESVALYIESPESRALWIALDFMDFNRRVTDTLKSAVAELTGLDESHIHILTTHNHGGGNPDLELLSVIVAKGALRAVRNAKSALMRYVFTRVDKQVNILRRIYIPELSGVATLYFGACEKNGFESALFAENAIAMAREGKECNYIGETFVKSRGKFAEGDTELVALEFAEPDGTPIGSVVRFAAHAVCANRPDSYSSDYPYHVRRTMEERFGGVSMFLNGPCAEIAPVMSDKFEGREKLLGEYLANTALASLSSREFMPLTAFFDRKEEIKLPVRREILENRVDGIENLEMPETLPERRRYFEKKRLSKTLPFLQEKYSRGEAEPSDEISVFIGLLVLNNVCFLAFPGETFYATGKAVKDLHSDLEICTVTEHERTVMYIPPKEDFALGGYESVCKVTSPDSEYILRAQSAAIIDKYKEKIK